jgi:ABC-type transport system substrate-binding protein
MTGKYVLFAVAALLVLSSASTAFAATKPLLSPGSVKTVGPQINSITYLVASSDTTAVTDMQAGNINAYDLSFSVADITTMTTAWTNCKSTTVPPLTAGNAICTGSTPGYSFDGIDFNMLRAVVNDTHFHRAIAYLMNLTYFEDSVLEGVAGISTNALMPCAVFAACAKTGPTYDSSTDNALVHAVWELQAIRECIGPFTYKGACASYGPYFLTAETAVTGSTNSSDCAPLASQPAGNFNWASYSGNGCAGLVWKYAITAQGVTAGQIFYPNWVYRISLNRLAFSQIVPSEGAKIGLTFDIPGGFCSQWWCRHPNSGAAVIEDGKYIASGPLKGYNTAPVYNYSLTVDGAIDGRWDMYSYGYSASINFVGNAELMDDAFGSTGVDATSYHNGTASYDANKIVYATTASQAVTYGRKLALDQLVNLPYLNVYFENTLYGVFANGWAGYADIPTYGPSTSAGLGYTALNVHRTCFVAGLTTPPNTAKCPNGGNFKLGLAAAPDVPSGLNPLYSGLTVYDDDVWLNIYDSVLATPPMGFTKPAQFINWMTTKFTEKTCTTTVANPAKCVGKTAGWFDFQDGPSTYGTGMRALPIYKGTVYTFTFRNNIYWTDGVQMNAYDYNFSLWASGLVAPKGLPDLGTDYSAYLSGPLGLMATYINPSNPFQISVVVNSSSVWNSGNLMVPILPEHIWAPYFNLDSIFGSVLTIDTSQPYALATAYSNFTSGCPPADTEGCHAAPTWLTNEPNLEVATGPFQLVVNNEVTGGGLLARNLMYYRNYWQSYTINASQRVAKGTSYDLSLPIYQYQYNATLCPTQAQNTCQVLMGGPGTDVTPGSGTADVVTAAGKVLESIPLTFSGGYITASTPTSTLSVGPHEVIVTFTYTYLGLPRTYYEQYGFEVLT